MKLSGQVAREDWRLGKPFIISREVTTHVTVVMVELSDGVHRGRGEACPVAHFGESVDQVVADIQGLLERLADEPDPRAVVASAPAGAARNAVDCALWDLRAKQAGVRIDALLERPALVSVETVLTLSLNPPEVMAAAAVAARDHAILKLKLGAAGDADRVRAVRAAVPRKRLIVDVNEGWSLDDLRANMPVMAELGVEMIEQPLPAGRDEGLAQIDRLTAIGADESCHTSADLDRVAGLYDIVNIKLDKTGGLTEALRLAAGARERGLGVMVGCMLGTSLAMAPGVVVAQGCRFVDLDAPLLIGRDREPALTYSNGLVSAPEAALWG